MQQIEQQLSNLYDQYADRIFKYCFFRVSSREEAEDLASKVFIKTLEYLQNGNTIEHPKTFLYKIANNLIIDFYRTNKRNRTVSLDDDNYEIDIPFEVDFIENLDTQHAFVEVRQSIERLPEKYRLVVILRYIDDLSITEIAAVTGLSQNNISVRLHRAIEKLKDSKSTQDE